MGSARCAGDLKFRHVAALRQHDPHRPTFALDEVEMLERTPQPLGFHAHDRIERWIEAVASAEYDSGYGVCLDPAPSAGQVFLDDILQEMAVPFRCIEVGGAEDTAQFETNKLRRTGSASKADCSVHAGFRCTSA